MTDTTSSEKDSQSNGSSSSKSGITSQLPVGRLVYVAKLPPCVFVLHAFMKKSKTGRSIPNDIRRTILRRFKSALELSRSFGREGHEK